MKADRNLSKYQPEFLDTWCSAIKRGESGWPITRGALSSSFRDTLQSSLQNREGMAPCLPRPYPTTTQISKGTWNGGSWADSWRVRHFIFKGQTLNNSIFSSPSFTNLTPAVLVLSTGNSPCVCSTRGCGALIWVLHVPFGNFLYSFGGRKVLISFSLWLTF